MRANVLVVKCEGHGGRCAGADPEGRGREGGREGGRGVGLVGGREFFSADSFTGWGMPFLSGQGVIAVFHGVCVFVCLSRCSLAVAGAITRIDNCCRFDV